MKWIQLILWKIQSGHDSVHKRTDGKMDGRTDGRTDRWTDGQGETSIPPIQLCWCGGYNYVCFLLIIRTSYPRSMALKQSRCHAVKHLKRLTYWTKISWLWLYPTLQRSWKGGVLVSPCPSVHLSIRPSVCLSVCPFVDRIVSALYLEQYSSDPFHICTSYQATSEGVLHVMFVSKLKNLKFWRIL